MLKKITAGVVLVCVLTFLAGCQQTSSPRKLRKEPAKPETYTSEQRDVPSGIITREELERMRNRKLQQNLEE